MRTGENAFQEAGARRSLVTTALRVARELLRSVLRRWCARRAGAACFETAETWFRAGGAAAGVAGGVPLESLVEPPETWCFAPEFCSVPVAATFAVACVPLEPVPACTLAVAGGAETEAEAVVCAGAALTLACVEAGGVVAPVETDADGVGAACAVAVTVTDAVGVLALTFALAAGAGAVVTDAVTETLGAAGVPGNPSACAGRAYDKHHSAPVPRRIRNRRKRRFRVITVDLFVGGKLVSTRTYPVQRKSKPKSDRVDVDEG